MRYCVSGNTARVNRGLCGSASARSTLDDMVALAGLCPAATADTARGAPAAACSRTRRRGRSPESDVVFTDLILRGPFGSRVTIGETFHYRSWAEPSTPSFRSWVWLSPLGDRRADLGRVLDDHLDRSSGDGPRLPSAQASRSRTELRPARRDGAGLLPRGGSGALHGRAAARGGSGEPGPCSTGKLPRPLTASVIAVGGPRRYLV